jgi:hypothetical protein
MDISVFIEGKAEETVFVVIYFEPLTDDVECEEAAQHKRIRASFGFLTKLLGHVTLL